MNNSAPRKRNSVAVGVVGIIVVALSSAVVIAQEPVKSKDRPESPTRDDRRETIARPTSRERTQDENIADVERVIKEGDTRLAVSFAEESYLEISVMRGPNAIQTLGLQFEETTKTWTPVVPEALIGTLWGIDFPVGFGNKDTTDTEATVVAKIGMRPFDPSIVTLPHDDVSVFVVDGELVLISLWEKGMAIGVYYALALDDRVGSVATANSGVDVGKVCMKLLDTCLGQKDTYWVQACGYWLQHCAALQQ